MSSSHPIKRSYSEAALALWLERLAGNWEENFSPAELEAARAIYRRGDVHDIRLSNHAATVFSFWNDESVHAVVEWDAGRLSWRTTLESHAESAALAAASLYEVEEFLGDELADRVLETASATTEPEAPLPSEKPEPQAVVQPQASEPEAPSPHELALLFSVDETGAICCAPVWVKRDVNDFQNTECLPAYGAGAPVAGELLPPDSGSLLRLVTHARRCGFVLDAAAGRWRLQSPSGCELFVREELPRWSQRWRVGGTEDLLILGRRLAPKPLHLDACIEATDGGDDALSPWDEDDSPEEKPAKGMQPRPGGHTANAGPSFRLRWRHCVFQRPRSGLPFAATPQTAFALGRRLFPRQGDAPICHAFASQ